MTRKHFSIPLYACLCFFLVIASTLWMPMDASAQMRNSKAPSLLLENRSQTYDLSEYLQIFTDSDKDGQLKDLMREYYAGRGESLKTTDLKNLHLPPSDAAYWLFLTIKNEHLTTENWYLTLGRLGDMTQGHADRIAFFEWPDASPKMMDGRVITNKRQLFTQKENALPLYIKTGRTKTIALYIEPTAGQTISAPIHLVAEKLFIQQHENSELIADAFHLCAMFLVILFAALVFTFKSPIPAYLAGYILLSYFSYKNTGILISDGNDTGLEYFGQFTLFAFLCAALMHLNTFRAFPSIQKISTFLIGGFIGLNLILFTLLSYTEIRIALDITHQYWPFIAATFLFISAFHANAPTSLSGSMRQLYFSWFILIIGAGISFLSKNAFIPATPMLMHAFWFAFPFHFAFLAFSILRIMSSNQARLRNIEQDKKRKEVAQTELQKSKEIADQERLVNILQRERELLSELREREAERATAMKEAKEIADQANQAKSAFLAVISHEIRTPMTGIMGMVRLIGKTPLNEDQLEYVQTIESSGDTLLALLNDILDLSKVEEGQMTIEEISFDLHKMLKSVVLLMTGRADEQGIDLRSDIDPLLPQFIKGDPIRIRQILLNLVSNAVKFTKRGHVTVVAELAKQNDSNFHVYFAVRDTGIGITKEAQENLFTPFTQADSTIARNFGGTGLGLAICKKLVEAMGGNILIDSQSGRGSKFFFTLPMKEGDEADESLIEVNNLFVPPMKILVADDNKVNQKVVRTMLEYDKHNITTVDDGQEALNAVRADRYDAVFMDMEMPGMTGVQATQAIRSLPDQVQSSIPIIAMTANTMQEDIDKCFAAGMNDYVSKPIDPDSLKYVLSKLADDNIQKTATKPRPDRETPAAIVEDTPSQNETVAGIVNHHAPLTAQPNDVALPEDNTENAPVLRATPATEAPNLAPNDFAGTQSGPEKAAGDVMVAPALKQSTPTTYTADIPMAPPMDDIDETPMPAPTTAPADMIEIPTPTDTPIKPAIQAIETLPITALFDDSVLGGLRDSLGADAVIDMMSDLYPTSEDILDKMDEAIASNDMDALRLQAHSMRGMMSNFGLSGIGDLSGEIEDMVRDGSDFPTAIAKAQTLRAIYHQTKDALEDYLSG